MIQVFHNGATVGVWVYVEDWEGVPTTPDNGIKVTITDPDEVVKVNAQAMTPQEAGVLYYHYTLSADAAKGWGWTVTCKAQDGTGGSAKYTIESCGFKVK